MKRIILSLALVSATVSFAQKKEINAAFKAAESGDIAKTKSQVEVAEAAVANAGTVAPDLLEKLYYAKGLAQLKSGDVAGGAKSFAKISDLKTDKFSPSLTPKIVELVSPLVESSNKTAIEAYNAKNYATAANKFGEVYNLLNAAGQDNKQYLYYSAIAYALGEDRNNAISAYNELINSGYTGVTTKYLAKNKKSGNVEELDKASWDLMKKAGAGADYTDFKTEVTKSVEEELYETNAQLLLDAERYDEAIELTKKGTQKFPKNAKLTEIQGMAYYKSGKTEQFMASLKDLVAKNPQDKISWYNLGVLASKDPSKKEEAESYFKKAVEIDSNYGPAYQNLTHMLMDLDNDGKHIDEYNALRKAGKAAEANKIIEARRERFRKALPYAEKWYATEPNNVDAVSLLKGLYQSTGNEAKFKEFKAKEEALQKK